MIELPSKRPAKSQQSSSEESMTKRCLFCGEPIRSEDRETFFKTGRCLRCQAKVKQ